MQITISHHTHDPLPPMAAKISSSEEFAWLTLEIGDTEIRIFAHDRQGAREALRHLRSAIDAAGREDVFATAEKALAPGPIDEQDRAIARACDEITRHVPRSLGEVLERISLATEARHALALRHALAVAVSEGLTPDYERADRNISFWLSRDPHPRLVALYEPLLRETFSAAAVDADAAGADFTERRLGAALGGAA